jgi:hypothetical protein
VGRGDYGAALTTLVEERHLTAGHGVRAVALRRFQDALEPL